MDFVQMEQIMEKAFRATISQKFQFWMHRNLLNRFWKAMEQNIRLVLDALRFPTPSVRACVLLAQPAVVCSKAASKSSQITSKATGSSW